MSLQNISLLGLLVCVGVLAGAYYLEYEYMLAACPLCILQRIIFFGLGITFIIGSIFKISGRLRYVYTSSIVLLASTGLAIASRQLWLQYIAPPQKVSCSASLQHLLDIHPVFDALKISLMGTSDCATIDFTILGLSIAAWSFAIFAATVMGFVYVLWLQKNRRI